MKQFYVLIVGNLLEVYGGPSYGTKYDLTHACPLCGTGSEPIGPRIISDLTKTKKGLFLTFHYDTLMDLDLAEKFTLNGIQCLAEVHKTRGDGKSPFMELRGDAVLPPFSPKTTGYELEGQCIKCKRDGHYNIPQKKISYVYENINPDLLEHNVLVTYERFGISHLRTPFTESVFATPDYIVSDLVKKILEEENIKNIAFSPVKIILA